MVVEASRKRSSSRAERGTRLGTGSEGVATPSGPLGLRPPSVGAGRRKPPQRPAAARPSPFPTPGSLTGTLGSRITRITALKLVYKTESLALLQEVARLVLPLMHSRGFRVVHLTEFYPLNPGLLGLNVNRGAKVCIRLRAARNAGEFLPLGDLVGTMLHELVHNLHGPHDATFFKHLDELQTEFEQIQVKGALAVTGYVSEKASVLGGRVLPPGERHGRMFRGTYVGERRRLGGAGGETTLNLGAPDSAAQAAALAAARRFADSLCCQEPDEEPEVEPEEEPEVEPEVNTTVEATTIKTGGNKSTPMVTEATSAWEDDPEVIEMVRGTDGELRPAKNTSETEPPHKARRRDHSSVVQAESLQKIAGATRCLAGSGRQKAVKRRVLVLLPTALIDLTSD